MARIKYLFISCLILASFHLSNVNGKSYRSSSRGHFGSHSKHHGYGVTNHQSHSHPHSSGVSSDGHSTSRGHHVAASYPGSSGLSGNAPSGSNSNNIRITHAGQLNSVPGGSNPAGSYPASTGLSGTGTHHSGNFYPPSPGLSGNTPSGGSHHHNSQHPNTHTEVNHHHTNTQLSGTGTHHSGSSYPPSPGLSGNTPSGEYSSYHQNSQHLNTHKEVHHHHTNTHTVHHHHYVYNPPTVIHYVPSYGRAPINYPVYSGHVPTYVYDYRSSGNKYGALLAGLALLNLGMIASRPDIHHYHKHYTPQPDEVCKFGVRYQTGSYDEMAIDCRAITNFIWAEQSKPQTVTQVVNQTVVTTNVQTQTAVPNGSSLVPANASDVSINSTQTLSSNVVPNIATVNTVTTTQVYTVSDPKYHGDSVKVSEDMECYVTRSTSVSNMKKMVPCDLLNTYAVKSLQRQHRSAAVNVKPIFSITFAIVVKLLLL